MFRAEMVLNIQFGVIKVLFTSQEYKHCVFWNKLNVFEIMASKGSNQELMLLLKKVRNGGERFRIPRFIINIIEQPQLVIIK